MLGCVSQEERIEPKLLSGSANQDTSNNYITITPRMLGDTKRDPNKCFFLSKFHNYKFVNETISYNVSLMRSVVVVQ